MLAEKYLHDFSYFECMAYFILFVLLHKVLFESSLVASGANTHRVIKIAILVDKGHIIFIISYITFITIRIHTLFRK